VKKIKTLHTSSMDFVLKDSATHRRFLVIIGKDQTNKQTKMFNERLHFGLKYVLRIMRCIVHLLLRFVL